MFTFHDKPPSAHQCQILLYNTQYVKFHQKLTKQAE